MNRIFKLSAILFSFIILFASCKKDKDENETTKKETLASVAGQNAEADIVSQDIMDVSEQIINNIGVNNQKNGVVKWNCATLTYTTLYDSQNNPYYKIVADFGNDSTLCFNGKYSGQMIISFRGRYFFEGFSDTITFNNFRIHRRVINGKHIVSNIGNLTWNVEAHISVTRLNGQTHSWDSYRVRELLITNSSDTSANNIKNKWSQFVYKVSDQQGKMTTGVNWNGNSYAISIINPIKKHLDCYYIQSGTINISIDGNFIATFDFGIDGICDNKATITYNGEVYNITL